MKIAVGSTNPAKLAAVEKAVTSWFSSEKIEILSASVESTVSNQPLSDEETLKGATSRAERVLQSHPEAECAIGLEGGIAQVGDEWFVMGWVTLVTPAGAIFSASTVRFPLLPQLTNLILKDGLELGAADDQLFNRTNSKQQNGYIGILTQDHISRAGIFSDAVLVVLGRLNLENTSTFSKKPLE